MRVAFLGASSFFQHTVTVRKEREKKEMNLARRWRRYEEHESKTRRFFWEDEKNCNLELLRLKVNGALSSLQFNSWLLGKHGSKSVQRVWKLGNHWLFCLFHMRVIIIH